MPIAEVDHDPWAAASAAGGIQEVAHNPWETAGAHTPDAGRFGSITSQAVKGIPLIGALAEKGAAAANAVADPAVDALRGAMGKQPLSPGNYSERYARHLEEMRGANKQFEENHPVLAPALQVGGGTMATMGLAGGAPGALTRGPAMTIFPPRGAPAVNIPGQIGAAAPNAGSGVAREALGMGGTTLPGQIARSAGSGAVLGGADAALRDESAPGGAAIGAVTGVAGPVAGRFAGILANRARGVAAGPLKGQLAPGGESVADRAVAPTAADVKGQTNLGYDASRATGVEFHPNAISSLANTNKIELGNRGWPDYITPRVHATLDRMRAADPSRGYTVNDLLAAHTTLGEISRGTDKTEAAAARHVRNSLDAYLEQVPMQDVRQGDPALLRGVYPDARANSAAQHKLEDAETRQFGATVDAATAGSGHNVNNRTRQGMKSTFKKETRAAGNSPEEVEQLGQAVMGTPYGNTMRTIGNVLGGGGGLGRAHAAGWGAIIGDHLAGPAGGAAGAAALPAAGYFARKLAEGSTARNMAKYNEMVALNSPAGKYARQARQEMADTNNQMQRGGAMASRAGEPSIAGLLQQMFGDQQQPRKEPLRITVGPGGGNEK